jgi:hypothetical protein
VWFPPRHLGQTSIDVDHDAVHVDEDALEGSLGQHVEALFRLAQLFLFRGAQEREPQQRREPFSQLAGAILGRERQGAATLFERQPWLLAGAHGLDAVLGEQGECLVQPALGVSVGEQLRQLSEQLM